MNKIVSPSPHIHSPLSTKRLMLDVIYALMPAVILSCLLYGWKELLLLVVSVVSCVGLEYLINRFLLKKPSTIADHSAVVTGILLALNVPVSCPWWVMVIGAVIAIGVVKMTFGGLGQNIFNPAIAARVFLLLSFPVYMTDWAYTPTALFSNIDAVSGPTLLGVLNEQGISALGKLDWRMRGLHFPSLALWRFSRLSSDSFSSRLWEWESSSSSTFSPVVFSLVPSLWRPTM